MNNSLLTGARLNTIQMNSMNNLTKAQQRVFDFVQAQVSAGLPVPTHREIAAKFGYRSPRAAAGHLEAIERKGFLRSQPGKARSLQIINPLQKLLSRVVDIPVYGSIPAGLAEHREQEAEGCVRVDIGSIGYKPTANAFAVQVTGDSMIGRHILSGDYVILEPGPEPRIGEVVAAYIDGESTLKTYLVKNGKPYLKAENPKYPDLVPAQNLVIQGVFRALIRPAKN